MQNVLSRTHKIQVTSYLAPRDKCQSSILAILHEGGRSTLSSRAPQQTDYL